MTEEAKLAAQQAEEFFRHRHRPTHEEIAKLAFKYWEEDGKPLFDEAITFSNWVDAVMELEGRHKHAPSGPGHDIE